MNSVQTVSHLSSAEETTNSGSDRIIEMCGVMCGVIKMFHAGKIPSLLCAESP